jgi:hypothetical protein
LRRPGPVPQSRQLLADGLVSVAVHPVASAPAAWVAGAFLFEHHLHAGFHLKLSLLFLLLPLHSFAQFGRSYTGPTMQQNMQSRQDFNRMANQRTMDFQSRQMQKTQNNRSAAGMQPLGPEARRQAQAKQQQAEQEANERLARLAQEQQRQRQAHPAPSPQQAASQQREDDRQLALLALKNYRDVFLAGQISSMLQARDPSPQAQQRLQTLNETLTSDAWWSRKEGPQLAAKVMAYGDTLTALTADLLGYSLVSLPPIPEPLASSRLDAMLAQGTFTQATAGQLLQEEARAEKIAAGAGLAEAVVAFQNLSASSAASPELQRNPKKLRKQVEASLRLVNAELQRYQARIYFSNRLPAAQKALTKATTAYLAKYGS